MCVCVIEAEFEGTERFGVIRRLGAGGMGVVYEVEDRERGAVVALKSLRKQDSNTLYRLKREFRTLAELHHPNLVSLYELVVGDESFITMELLDGVDFMSYVRPRTLTRAGTADDDTMPAVVMAPPSAAAASLGGFALESTNPESANRAPLVQAKLDEPRLRMALRQLVRGLAALHAAGIVHRDVKPSNVMVSREGRVVVLDFGLAAEANPQGEGSLDGIPVGTVPYMAPEQCTGDHASPAADWYSLGVMLYEALTGTLPFEGHAMQVLLDKQTKVPPPPSARAQAVPADLEELCMALLARDPDVRPKTSHLLRRLGVERDGQRASSMSLTRAAPFTGRETELSVLTRALEGLRTKGTTIVSVRGTSGIGKTALIRAFLEQVKNHHHRSVTLSGRCYERETVAYNAMDSLIDNLSRYWMLLPADEAAAIVPRDAYLLSRLFPVLARVPAISEAPRKQIKADPQELRTRAFRALREVFERLSDRHTTVMVLDDMQWVDSNTLVLLADLFRSPDAPPILVVLSMRKENTEAIETLVERTGCPAEVIDLHPLSDAAGTELAQQLLGDQGSSLAMRIAREAAGSPFFIGELVQYVQSSEAVDLSAVRLDQVLSERLELLPKKAQRLLELTSIAGEPITRRVAVSASLLSGTEAMDLIGVLRTLHFLRASGMRADDRLEPYHNRVRDAVIANLSAEDRTAHHRALALALEQWQDGGADQLARHWQGAGDLGRAAEWANRAADEAMGRLDFDRASRLFEVTLELGNFEPDAERELLVLMGTALANAGRGWEAAETYLRAGEGAAPSEALELRRRSAEALLSGGHLDEGLRELRSVLAAIGHRLARSPRLTLLSIGLRRAWLFIRGLRWKPRTVDEIPPSVLRDLDIYWSAAVGLGVVDHLRGTDYQIRYTLKALRIGESKRAARALALEACFLAPYGAGARAEKVLDTAEAVAKAENDLHAQGLCAWARGAVDYYSYNKWRRSIEHLNECLRLMRGQQTAGWEQDTAQLVTCWNLQYLGDFNAMSRQVPAYILEAERHGDRYAQVNMRTRASIIWLVRDDPDGGERDLRAAIDSWPSKSKTFLIQHFFALFGLSEIEMYRGRPAAVLEMIDRDRRQLSRSMLLHLPMVSVEVNHAIARACIAVARKSSTTPETRKELLARAAKLAKRIRRVKAPVGAAIAELVFAGIAAVRGDNSAAEAALRKAIVRLDALECELFSTAARERLATMVDEPEQQALLAKTSAWWAERSVRAPVRMVRMLVPGWKS